MTGRSMKEKAKSLMHWNTLWILFFGAAFAIFFCGMPKYHDDYWFMYHLQPWFAQQGIVVSENGGNIFRYGIPWQMVFDTWQEHFNNDNIRLGNLLVVFLLLLPKWFGSGLMAIALVWTVMLGFRLAGVDWRRSPLVPFMLALWTLALPWSNSFGVLVFQMNYIPPTFLSLLLLSRITRDTEHHIKPRLGRAILNVVICWLIGAWHEGFGVPIGATLLAMMLIFKSWRRADIMIGAVIMLLASGIILMMPGMVIRRGLAIDKAMIEGTIIFNIKRIFRYFVYLYTLALPCTAIILSFKRYRKKNFSHETMAYLLIGGAAAIFVMIVSHAASRMAFMTQGFSIIVLAQLILIVLHRKIRRYGIATSLLFMPLYIFSMVHMGYVDAYAFKYRKMMHDALRACSRKEEFVFESVPLNIDRPIMLGGRPEYIHDFSEYLFPKMQVFYQRVIPEDRKDGFTEYSAIFPYGFERIDNTQGVVLNEEQGIRKWHDYFYIPYDSLKKIGRENVEKGEIYRDFMVFEADYGKGYLPMTCGFYKFRSPRDGREYVWLVAPIPWRMPYIRELKRARLRVREGH